MRISMLIVTLAAAMATSAPGLAQQSTSFVLTEHVLNAGGAPVQGTALTSTSFRMTLAALGDGVVARGLTSASYGADISFVPAYAPPGEVMNLDFADATTLVWDAEPSVGHYNLYRDLASALPGLGYGACLDPLVVVETATDTAVPPDGAIYFYLVTAENRLLEEGTKGYSSAGAERQGTDCP